MIKSKRWHTIIAALLMLGLAVLACSPQGGGETPAPAPTPTLTLPPPPQARCGDGVCDGVEQQNPDLCSQDCPSPAPPTAETPAPMPLDTPPPATRPPEPGSKCGDGLCDEIEKNDPNLCPQDCGGATAPPGEATPLPATGVPDYEPPINVYLVLHIDPMGDQESTTFKPDQRMYTLTYNEIDWLAEEAARHGLRFTSLYNGWYPQWALKEGDTGQFRALLDAGHEIGSHAHRITYDADTDTWIKHVEELGLFGRPSYDPELARQCWDDAHRYVEAVLGQIGAAGQNQTMCSTALSLSDEDDLMAEFGFTIAAGNRMEKGLNYFGHMVWNPWRAANSDEPGQELAEDLDAGYITFNHLAQIGGGGSVGMPAEAHGQDLTLPQMQRRFLMLYAEWLARERSGAKDRVWAFGFVYHPNYGDRYNAETAAFLDWLDAHFIGQTSPHGHTIARYATVGEIAAEFTAWETAHPGVSSFNYVRDNPYPYTYAALPTMLGDAAYEAHVALEEGVSCFRFSRDGQAIYMLWADLGERTVDLSGELSGQVRVTNAAGQESILDAASLPLSEDPLFVESMP